MKRKDRKKRKRERGRGGMREKRGREESNRRKEQRPTYPLYLSNVVSLIVPAAIEHWSLHRVSLRRKTVSSLQTLSLNCISDRQQQSSFLSGHSQYNSHIPPYADGRNAAVDPRQGRVGGGHFTHWCRVQPNTNVKDHTPERDITTIQPVTQAASLQKRDMGNMLPR